MDSRCWIGEALALTWADIDLDRETVAIRRTLVGPDRVGAPVTHPPKTKRSVRTFTLMPATITALRAHRVCLKAEQLAAGPKYIDYNLVFPTAHGTAYQHRTVRDARRLALKRANPPPIRTHDLRHTMATLAFERNANARTVSDRLGYASVAMTLGVYGHVTQSMERDTVNRLSQALDLQPAARCYIVATQVANVNHK